MDIGKKETKTNSKRCIACVNEIHIDSTTCPFCRKTQSTNPWSNLGVLLKWIGGITATLSLVVTMYQVGNLFDSFKRKQEAVSNLVLTGNLQREYSDYPASWESYEKALELDPGSLDARDEQISLAKIWLRDMRFVKNQSTEIVNKLTPTLYKGVAVAKTNDTISDLSAHLGWANYLLYKDRNTNVSANQVDAHFKFALKNDPENMYANTMRGFWIIISNRNISDHQLKKARKHFSVALNTRKNKTYVRHMQISAHLAVSSYEIVRVVSEMQKNGEAIPNTNKFNVLQLYYAVLSNGENLKKMLSLLPARDHLAAFLSLTDGSLVGESKSQQNRYIVAKLKERMGENTDALSMYKMLREELKSSGGSLPREVERAIKLLEKADLG